MARTEGAKNYDWSKWIDGEMHLATKGEDFTTSIKMFRQNLYTQASYRQLSVKVEILDDNDVVFQFTERKSSDNGRV